MERNHKPVECKWDHCHCVLAYFLTGDHEEHDTLFSIYCIQIGYG